MTMFQQQHRHALRHIIVLFFDPVVSKENLLISDVASIDNDYFFGWHLSFANHLRTTSQRGEEGAQWHLPSHKVALMLVVNAGHINRAHRNTPRNRLVWSAANIRIRIRISIIHIVSSACF